MRSSDGVVETAVRRDQQRRRSSGDQGKGGEQHLYYIYCVAIFKILCRHLWYVANVLRNKHMLDENDARWDGL